MQCFLTAIKPHQGLAHIYIQIICAVDCTLPLPVQIAAIYVIKYRWHNEYYINQIIKLIHIQGVSKKMYQPENFNILWTTLALCTIFGTTIEGPYLHKPWIFCWEIFASSKVISFLQKLVKIKLNNVNLFIEEI